MRWALSSSAHGDKAVVEQCLDFLHRLETSFATINLSHREYAKKMQVLSQSTHKVETALYKLHIRLEEFPNAIPPPTLEAPDEVDVV